MPRPLTAVPLTDTFFDSPIAHRGLHDCGGKFGFGRTENSSAAFRLAISKGYGIEVDIQLSSDGVPVVFHDKSLKRLLKVNQNLSELTMNSLRKLRLENKEKILAFDEFLELVSGQVPILVELKDQDSFLGKNNCGISDAVAIHLKKYTGPVAVMSFNPRIVKEFGFKLPNIPRGLVTEAFKKSDWPELDTNKLTSLRCLRGVIETAASFISHEHSDLDSEYISQIPTATKVLSWTIRNRKEMKMALKRSENVTFEGFMP